VPHIVPLLTHVCEFVPHISQLCFKLPHHFLILESAVISNYLASLNIFVDFLVVTQVCAVTVLDTSYLLAELFFDAADLFRAFEFDSPHGFLHPVLLFTNSGSDLFLDALAAHFFIVGKAFILRVNTPLHALLERLFALSAI